MDPMQIYDPELVTALQVVPIDPRDAQRDKLKQTKNPGKPM